MELIEASILAGVRPTTMILGKDNRKAWSPMDVTILAAYQRYKNEMCPDHGGPIWLCRNTDRRLFVRVVPGESCVAKEAVDEYQEKHKDDDEKKSARPEFYVRGEEDFPLHKLRTPYYEALGAPDPDDDDAD